MTLASLGIAALFGLVLMANRQISLYTASHFGPVHARVIWWLNVALPFGVMLAIVPNYAIIGWAVAAGLSFGVHQCCQYAQTKKHPRKEGVGEVSLR
jgi:hypothetical protein